jgi:competence protein ComEA
MNSFEKSTAVLAAIFACLVIAILIADRPAPVDTVFLEETVLSQDGEFGSVTMGVRINYASLYEITVLPGIGEKIAARIVEYREENGFFASMEDLMKVEGIGEKTAERIKELVIFD